MHIVNLTGRRSNNKQREDGVFDLPEKTAEEVRKILVRPGQVPSASVTRSNADELADIAEKSGADAAMIDGDLRLMGPLEDALAKKGIQPLYDRSERVVKEFPMPDGSVFQKKVPVHTGFILPPADHDPVQFKQVPDLKPKILNLTGKVISEKQQAAGVIDPQDKEDIRRIKKILKSKGLITAEEILEKAELLSDIAKKEGCREVMIEGNAWLMNSLEKKLAQEGMKTVYAIYKLKEVPVRKGGEIVQEEQPVLQGFAPAGTAGVIYSAEEQRLQFLGLRIREQMQLSITKEELLQKIAKDKNLDARLLSMDENNIVHRAVITEKGSVTDVPIGKCENAILLTRYREPELKKIYYYP